MSEYQTQTYSIISDVEIDSHDASVRLYWTGSDWSDDVESSFDYEDVDTAKGVVREVKNSYPMAQIQILSVYSESKFKLIDIYQED